MNWQARGTVDALTYRLDLTQPAPSEIVDEVVRDVLNQRRYVDSVEDYVAAARTLLADPEPVARNREDEACLRDYLSRVVAGLEAYRPWPVRMYRRVPAGQWPQLPLAPVVGRVPRSWRFLEAHLNAGFEFPTVDDAVLVIELLDGPAVAFTASVVPPQPVVEVHASDVDAQLFVPELARMTGLVVEPLY